MVAVLLGVVILAAIVVTGQSKKSDDATPSATPSAVASESTAPEATPTEEAPSMDPAPEATSAVSTGEAPTNFIGNWKDSSTKDVLVLTWKAPAGDVTGYKVEISFNGGEWNALAELPATTLKQEVSKSSDSKYTSFRVSAVYSDGSLGTAKAFGFAGEFK